MPFFLRFSPHVKKYKIHRFQYALILSIVVQPMAPWTVVLGFVAMHLVTGLLISSVFQIAHMPGMDYPLADRNGKENSPLRALGFPPCTGQYLSVLYQKY